MGGERGGKGIDLLFQHTFLNSIILFPLILIRPLEYELIFPRKEISREPYRGLSSLLLPYLTLKMPFITGWTSHWK